MSADFAVAVTEWYAGAKRELPWREPGCSAWSVLVSEFMLQQTPVKRVLPLWEEWMERWPTPAALACESPGEAIRAWGRLGYPHRARRLHAIARTICAEHGGEVPLDPAVLRTLEGVGDYTAAAVAAFAGGARVAVLDTNVRRVYARVYDGVANASTSAPNLQERARALDRLPDPPGDFSVAVMELGALICTARAPRCAACPVVSRCRWVARGMPAGQPRRTQAYAGTDREVRGRLLAVLRATDGCVDIGDLDVVWPDAVQRTRALAGLVADGLAERAGDASYRLPS